jgi:hypothetical protein
MATTDAKPGFRLPWSSDRSEAASPAESVADASAADPSTPPQENETTHMIDAAPAAPAHEAVVASEVVGGPAEPAPVSTPPVTTPAVARKPNKFMADLTRAMQAAAEVAREESLARFSADAKTHVEGIHADAAEEAVHLRKKADDDVAAIRDWSKAEIARIREESDERIAHRKTNLEQEIEEHAAYIERRIERVQARVDAFEAEMAAFFERLLAEDDPTRFAAMAESLPEPPSFDVDGPAPAPAPASAPAVMTVSAAREPEPVVEAEAVVETPVAEAVAASPVIEADVEAPALIEDAGATESPFYEPAPTDAPEGDAFGAATAAPSDTTEDPRLAVLGLGGSDFAAAEAEAASYAPDETSDGSDEPAPDLAEIADETIAARLAGLVPEGDAGTAEALTTRVVVTGLISVASIAGFKRHLSRAPGVQSVGVSSGPDGEFVFAVVHASDAAMRDVIPTLPGFGARVTNEADGEVVVSAHDPEAEG